MTVGTIFNIQRYSLQDGPGIRTTVFLKGCPLRCPWCSNPESQNVFIEIAHKDSLCQRCGRCVEICEVKATSLTSSGTKIDRKLCTNCGKCITVCPFGARRYYGEQKTVEEVFQEVIRDKPFYDNSGGGVTFSGGEPLLRSDFVAELFERCQSSGIHTCLDTCGYADPESWKAVLPYTDLVLFDLKIMDPSVHRKWTGKSSRKILQSLKLVAREKIMVIIRTPIIPGVNDSVENMTAIAKFGSSIGIKEINLLPYHRFGLSKFKMLDRRYHLFRLKSPDHSNLEKLSTIFESAGLTCKII